LEFRRPQNGRPQGAGHRGHVIAVIDRGDDRERACEQWAGSETERDYDEVTQEFHKKDKGHVSPPLRESVAPEFALCLLKAELRISELRMELLAGAKA
jgi:hypothetical protein